jgi:hypothetical protein
MSLRRTFSTAAVAALAGLTLASSADAALAPPRDVRVASATETAVTLTWRAPARLRTFSVWRGGRRVAVVRGNRFTFRGLRCAGSYRVGVATRTRRAASRRIGRAAHTRPCDTPPVEAPPADAPPADAPPAEVPPVAEPPADQPPADPVPPPVDQPPAQDGLPAAGIYQVWSKDSTAALPYVRGGQIVLNWAQLQPARGRFDWSVLDAELEYFASIGKPATVQVNSTPKKPAWIWSVVQRCGAQKGQEAPRYWDPQYMQLQTELVTGLAGHLKQSPYRKYVALVRAAPNAIGTELTDNPGCAGWSKDIRNRYYFDVMNLYRTRMLPEIKVALRTQVWTQAPKLRPPADWLGADGAWMMGTASDIDPAPVRDAFDAFMFQHARNGDSGAYQEPHYTTGKKHLVSWNYWRLLMELHKGVRCIAVYGQEIANGSNPEYRAAFDFVNRYAGYHRNPAASPGAWVALKQGPGRLAGNFTWFMRQLNPDTTSTAVESNAGAAIVGPTSQRYGRFARRIAGGTSKSTMSFALDPAFKAGLAGVGTQLRVTYLDAGTGSFEVKWGGGAQTLKKSGSGSWKTVSIPVAAAGYTGGLAGGADITVTALGSDTSTFHMVEVAVDGR